MNVYDIISNSAEKFPNNVAIIDQYGNLTYKELLQEIEDRCALLKKIGVSDGQGIGVMGRNGRNFIITAFAVLGCGATIMPMSYQLKQNEIDAVLSNTDLHAIIDDMSGISPLEKIGCPIEIPGIKPMRFAWTQTDKSQPFINNVQNPAIVRYTSGTTGTAKGVIISHNNVFERIFSANKGLQISPEDKILWILPMAFHFIVSIVLYLSVGSTIIICRDNLAQTLIEEGNRHCATFLYASPLCYRMLAVDKSGIKFNYLKHAISTSTGISEQTALSFLERFGLPITQAYGIIEVGLPIINLENPIENPLSIGHSLPDYQVAILDDNFEPLCIGEVGQLGIKGPGMFDAYLNPPIQKSEVLENGWFLTGDLAKQTSNGLITLVGRCKSLINVAGNKVFPEEVESVLNSHPAIETSHVFGREHPLLKEVVHAKVVLNDENNTIDIEELITFCSKQLTFSKVPQSITVVERIEKTESGKIFRR